MYETIVVGAHKMESARHAVAHALELARVHGSHVHLVTAYAKDSGPVDGRDTAGRSDAERSLDAMVPPAIAERCTTHALPGDPAKAVLDVAKEVNADLIVVGNKGMKGAKGKLLGSVPNDVAHRAACSVLIVQTT
jgi:nucleotide-binding universal stress UspA family protein